MEELIEHEVIINDMMEIKMKIPKKMTAMDLKALMVKANKIFSISDTSIDDSRSKIGVTSGAWIRGPRTAWTPETDKKMNKLWNDGENIRSVMSKLEEMGCESLTKAKVYSRKDYLMRNNKWFDNDGNHIASQPRRTNKEVQEKYMEAAKLVLEHNYNKKNALQKVLGREIIGGSDYGKIDSCIDKIRMGEPKDENKTVN